MSHDQISVSDTLLDQQSATQPRVRETDPMRVFRKLIEHHLDQVDHWTERVLKEGNADAETIHQQRISLRRAEMVFIHFRDYIPGQLYRWFIKHLNRLRKVSNPLRDADIFLEYLENYHEAGPFNGLKERAHNFQLGVLPSVQNACETFLRPDQFPERRTQLQRHLIEQLSRQDVENLARQSEVSPNEDLANWLSELKSSLSKHARKVFSLKRGWKGKKTRHQRRIEIKRLRYILELFEPYLPVESFQKTHAHLKNLQGKLGTLNDEVTILDRLDSWKNDARECPTERDEIKRLKRALRGDFSDRLKKFNAWWTDERRVKWKKYWRKFIDEIDNSTYQ